MRIVPMATALAAFWLTSCGDDKDEDGGSRSTLDAIPKSFTATGGSETEASTRVDGILAQVVDGSSARLGLDDGHEIPTMALQGYNGSMGMDVPDVEDVRSGSDCDSLLRSFKGSLMQMRSGLAQALLSTKSTKAMGEGVGATPWYTRTDLAADKRFTIRARFDRRDPTADESAMMSMLPTRFDIGFGASETMAALSVRSLMDVDYAKLGAANGAKDELGMGRMTADSSISTFVDATAQTARTEFHVEASMASSRGMMISIADGSVLLTGGDLPKLVLSSNADMKANGYSMSMASKLTLARNADGTLSASLNVDRAGDKQSAEATLLVANGRCTVK